jgi:hypothetical protein
MSSDHTDGQNRFTSHVLRDLHHAQKLMGIFERESTTNSTGLTVDCNSLQWPGKRLAINLHKCMEPGNGHSVSIPHLPCRKARVCRSVGQKTDILRSNDPTLVAHQHDRRLGRARSATEQNISHCRLKRAQRNATCFWNDRNSEPPQDRQPKTHELVAVDIRHMPNAGSHLPR